MLRFRNGFLNEFDIYVSSDGKWRSTLGNEGDGIEELKIHISQLELDNVSITLTTVQPPSTFFKFFIDKLIEYKQTDLWFYAESREWLLPFWEQMILRPLKHLEKISIDSDDIRYFAPYINTILLRNSNIRELDIFIVDALEGQYTIIECLNGLSLEWLRFRANYMNETQLLQFLQWSGSICKVNYFTCQVANEGMEIDYFGLEYIKTPKPLPLKALRIGGRCRQVRPFILPQLEYCELNSREESLDVTPYFPLVTAKPLHLFIRSYPIHESQDKLRELSRRSNHPGTQLIIVLLATHYVPRFKGILTVDLLHLTFSYLI
jgi:hypothetical protein